jgi:cold-inducible RNA-binding protein
VKKLYVGNLSFRATEDDLRGEFENLGIQTESVTVVRDRSTGQSRGFGFVEISNDGEVEKAIAGLNGKDVMGRAIVVNEARPQTDSRGGGGRGFQAGSGGGRGGRSGRGGSFRDR